MDIFEITGYQTGVSKAGVNFLQPSDSFQNIYNGFIYRQVLQSRQGIDLFAPRLAGETRVFGIFEHTLPNATKELLAFDQNFLYKYNTVTGVFDQIPFGGSMALYGGFAIAQKDFYISGTSYPVAQFLSGGGANPAFNAANQGARFIFTGEGIDPNANGSSVFFYNGTDVRDFTNLADNPNYAAPIQGALQKANYVVWFNERLNFIVPFINSITYQQGILYSGIRNNSGNGDKFNIAGSGLLELDTYENITGHAILGQILGLNADRSNWVLEKTRDAFNPYFSRKIPSVLGTDANFSAISWKDTIRSLGKTGALGMDGRQSLRVDDKVPYFTADEIDQISFNLTYGGFDRLNNQFLWAYKIYGTTSETQNSVLVNNYEEDTWSVYDQRFSVFGQTDVGLNLTWDDIEASLDNPSWGQWDTTEEIWDRIGLTLAVQKTLAGDDFGFIYELNQDFDDYTTNITAITQATSAVLTVDATAILPGDRVAIYEVEGMTEINNFVPGEANLDFEPYTVLAATPTSITIDADSSIFTAYTTGGKISKLISFYAETIPFNPYRDIGRRCYVSHVEFLIDNNGGNLRVDVFADDYQSPFKQNILCLPDPSTPQLRQWITMTVDNEANFHTFVMKQESPSVQLKITSVRIHCAPGGLTSG